MMLRSVNPSGAVAADFLDRHASSLAKQKEAERIINAEFVARWRDRPVTEIMPEEAARHVRVMATGRSDFPNQVNNSLGFPGIFRGVLDVGADLETHDDQALPRLRRGIEVFHAGNFPQQFFHGIGDPLLNFLCACPRHLHKNIHHGHYDLGFLLPGEG